MQLVVAVIFIFHAICSYATAQEYYDEFVSSWPTTDDGTPYEVITTKTPDTYGHPIINVNMIPIEPLDDSNEAQSIPNTHDSSDAGYSGLYNLAGNSQSIGTAQNLGTPQHIGIGQNHGNTQSLGTTKFSNYGTDNPEEGASKYHRYTNIDGAIKQSPAPEILSPGYYNSLYPPGYLTQSPIYPKVPSPHFPSVPSHLHPGFLGPHNSPIAPPTYPNGFPHTSAPYYPGEISPYYPYYPYQSHSLPQHLLHYPVRPISAKPWSSPVPLTGSSPNKSPPKRKPQTIHHKLPISPVYGTTPSISPIDYPGSPTSGSTGQKKPQGPSYIPKIPIPFSPLHGTTPNVHPSSETPFSIGTDSGFGEASTQQPNGEQVPTRPIAVPQGGPSGPQPNTGSSPTPGIIEVPFTNIPLVITPGPSAPGPETAPSTSPIDYPGSPTSGPTEHDKPQGPSYIPKIPIPFSPLHGTTPNDRPSSETPFSIGTGSGFGEASTHQPNGEQVPTRPIVVPQGGPSGPQPSTGSSPTPGIIEVPFTNIPLVITPGPSAPGPETAPSTSPIDYPEGPTRGPTGHDKPQGPSGIYEIPIPFSPLHGTTPNDRPSSETPFSIGTGSGFGEASTHQPNGEHVPTRPIVVPQGGPSGPQPNTGSSPTPGIIEVPFTNIPLVITPGPDTAPSTSPIDYPEGPTRGPTGHDKPQGPSGIYEIPIPFSPLHGTTPNDRPSSEIPFSIGTGSGFGEASTHQPNGEHVPTRPIVVPQGGPSGPQPSTGSSPTPGIIEVPFTNIPLVITPGPSAPGPETAPSTSPIDYPEGPTRGPTGHDKPQGPSGIYEIPIPFSPLHGTTPNDRPSSEIPFSIGTGSGFGEASTHQPNGEHVPTRPIVVPQGGPSGPQPSTGSSPTPGIIEVPFTNIPLVITPGPSAPGPETAPSTSPIDYPEGPTRGPTGHDKPQGPSGIYEIAIPFSPLHGTTPNDRPSSETPFSIGTGSGFGEASTHQPNGEHVPTRPIVVPQRGPSGPQPSTGSSPTPGIIEVPFTNIPLVITPGPSAPGPDTAPSTSPIDYPEGPTRGPTGHDKPQGPSGIYEIPIPFSPLHGTTPNDRPSSEIPFSIGTGSGFGEASTHQPNGEHVPTRPIVVPQGGPSGPQPSTGSSPTPGIIEVPFTNIPLVITPGPSAPGPETAPSTSPIDYPEGPTRGPTGHDKPQGPSGIYEIAIPFSPLHGTTPNDRPSSETPFSIGTGSGFGEASTHQPNGEHVPTRPIVVPQGGPSGPQPSTGSSPTPGIIEVPFTNIPLVVTPGPSAPGPETAPSTSPIDYPEGPTRGPTGHDKPQGPSGIYEIPIPFSPLHGTTPNDRPSSETPFSIGTGSGFGEASTHQPNGEHVPTRPIVVPQGGPSGPQPNTGNSPTPGLIDVPFTNIPLVITPGPDTAPSTSPIHYPEGPTRGPTGYDKPQRPSGIYEIPIPFSPLHGTTPNDRPSSETPFSIGTGSGFGEASTYQPNGEHVPTRPIVVPQGGPSGPQPSTGSSHTLGIIEVPFTNIPLVITPGPSAPGPETAPSTSPIDYPEGPTRGPTGHDKPQGPSGIYEIPIPFSPLHGTTPNDRPSSETPFSIGTGSGFGEASTHQPNGEHVPTRPIVVPQGGPSGPQPSTGSSPTPGIIEVPFTNIPLVITPGPDTAPSTSPIYYPEGPTRGPTGHDKPQGPSGIYEIPIPFSPLHGTTPNDRPSSETPFSIGTGSGFGEASTYQPNGEQVPTRPIVVPQGGPSGLQPSTGSSPTPGIIEVPFTNIPLVITPGPDTAPSTSPIYYPEGPTRGPTGHDKPQGPSGIYEIPIPFSPLHGTTPNDRPSSETPFSIGTGSGFGEASTHQPNGEHVPTRPIVVPQGGPSGPQPSTGSSPTPGIIEVPFTNIPLVITPGPDTAPSTSPIYYPEGPTRGPTGHDKPQGPSGIYEIPIPFSPLHGTTPNDRPSSETPFSIGTGSGFGEASTYQPNGEQVPTRPIVVPQGGPSGLQPSTGSSPTPGIIEVPFTNIPLVITPGPDTAPSTSPIYYPEGPTRGPTGHDKPQGPSGIYEIPIPFSPLHGTTPNDRPSSETPFSIGTGSGFGEASTHQPNGEHVPTRPIVVPQGRPSGPQPNTGNSPTPGLIDVPFTNIPLVITPGPDTAPSTSPIHYPEGPTRGPAGYDKPQGPSGIYEIPIPFSPLHGTTPNDRPSSETPFSIGTGSGFGEASTHQPNGEHVPTRPIVVPQGGPSGPQPSTGSSPTPGIIEVPFTNIPLVITPGPSAPGPETAPSTSPIDYPEGPTRGPTGHDKPQGPYGIYEIPIPFSPLHGTTPNDRPSSETPFSIGTGSGFGEASTHQPNGEHVPTRPIVVPQGGPSGPQPSTGSSPTPGIIEVPFTNIPLVITPGPDTAPSTSPIYYPEGPTRGPTGHDKPQGPSGIYEIPIPFSPLHGTTPNDRPSSETPFSIGTGSGFGEASTYQPNGEQVPTRPIVVPQGGPSGLQPSTGSSPTPGIIEVPFTNIPLVITPGPDTAPSTSPIYYPEGPTRGPTGHDKPQGPSGIYEIPIPFSPLHGTTPNDRPSSETPFSIGTGSGFGEASTHQPNGEQVPTRPIVVPQGGPSGPQPSTGSSPTPGIIEVPFTNIPLVITPGPDTAPSTSPIHYPEGPTRGPTGHDKPQGPSGIYEIPIPFSPLHGTTPNERPSSETPFSIGTGSGFGEASTHQPNGEQVPTRPIVVPQGGPSGPQPSTGSSPTPGLIEVPFTNIPLVITAGPDTAPSTSPIHYPEGPTRGPTGHDKPQGPSGIFEIPIPFPPLHGTAPIVRPSPETPTSGPKGNNKPQGPCNISIIPIPFSPLHGTAPIVRPSPETPTSGPKGNNKPQGPCNISKIPIPFSPLHGTNPIIRPSPEIPTSGPKGNNMPQGPCNISKIPIPFSPLHGTTPIIRPCPETPTSGPEGNNKPQRPCNISKIPIPFSPLHRTTPIVRPSPEIPTSGPKGNNMPQGPCNISKIPIPFSPLHGTAPIVRPSPETPISGPKGNNKPQGPCNISKIPIPFSPLHGTIPNSSPGSETSFSFGPGTGFGQASTQQPNGEQVPTRPIVAPQGGSSGPQPNTSSNDLPGTSEHPDSSLPIVIIPGQSAPASNIPPFSIPNGGPASSPTGNNKPQGPSGKSTNPSLPVYSTVVSVSPDSRIPIRPRPVSIADQNLSQDTLGTDKPSETIPNVPDYSQSAGIIPQT